MNNFVSIATISSPEFINLEPLDINPLMSKCEIKVLYLGKNRNGSAITKDVATEMSKECVDAFEECINKIRENCSDEQKKEIANILKSLYNITK